MKHILVFGGTGFVGSFICRELAEAGYTPVVVAHSGSSTYKTIQGDLQNPEQILENLKNTRIDAVIYSVGLLTEGGGKTYQQFHRDWVAHALNIAKVINCKRFILISANGIEDSQAGYATSKLAGEQLVQDSDLNWSILRPSIITGNSEHFNFAKLIEQLTIFPIAPVPAVRAQLQPVRGIDLGRGLARLLANQEAYGKILQVCGPEVVSFSQLVRKYAATKGKNVLTVPVPITLVKILAPLLRRLGQPVSAGQLDMLQKGNTCSSDEFWTLSEIRPEDPLQL